MDLPVVTVTPTVMDGVVVRWYVTTSAAEYGDPAVSASRNGVAVAVYLHLVSPAVLDAATGAYEILRAGRDTDRVRALATHRGRGLFGPLEPIAQPART